MSYPRKIVYRYSSGFKQKVVSEIESGKYTLAEVRSIYQISGHETVQKWIKKHGKNELLSKIVRVEMKDEKDQIKQLKKEKKALERALAQAQVKAYALENLIETAEEEFHLDIKKKFGSKVYEGILKKEAD